MKTVGIYATKKQVNVMLVTRVPPLATAVDLMELEETVIVLKKKSWISRQASGNINAFSNQNRYSMISGKNLKKNSHAYQSFINFYSQFVHPHFNFLLINFWMLF